MPFNLSMTHLAVVGIVALVVLGPERLPSVARTAGNLYREWQRIRGDLEGEVREAIAEFREPFLDQVQGIKDVLGDAVPSASAAPPLTTLPPLAAAGAVAELPALGEGTGLFTPRPPVVTGIPQLAPPPEPGTFVPYTPQGAD